MEFYQAVRMAMEA